MSDTPRTDAVTMTPREVDRSYGGCIIEGELDPQGDWIAADFARQLERELAAAAKRAEEAERARTEIGARQTVLTDAASTLAGSIIEAEERAERAESRLAELQAKFDIEQQVSKQLGRLVEDKDRDRIFFRDRLREIEAAEGMPSRAEAWRISRGLVVSNEDYATLRNHTLHLADRLNVALLAADIGIELCAQAADGAAKDFPVSTHMSEYWDGFRQACEEIAHRIRAKIDADMQKADKHTDMQDDMMRGPK